MKLYLDFNQLVEVERYSKENTIRIIELRIKEITDKNGSDFEIKQLKELNKSVIKYLSNINNIYFIK